MALSHVPIPPPGFDDLPRDEQLDYIERLIDRVEGERGGFALRPEVVQEIRARRERDRLHPEEALPADEVRARLRAKYA
jgi:putative addiction module component (TIGR02574 family)